MELERGDLDAVRTPPHPGITALLPAAPPQRALGAVSPEESTTLLRRCTALAARARVELLGGGRHPAGEQLAGVLAELAAWKADQVGDPGPTMTALTAAALQDLAERLPAEQAELTVHVDRALPVLRALLERTHPAASA